MACYTVTCRKPSLKIKPWKAKLNIFVHVEYEALTFFLIYKVIFVFCSMKKHSLNSNYAVEKDVKMHLGTFVLLKRWDGINTFQGNKSINQHAPIFIKNE